MEAELDIHDNGNSLTHDDLGNIDASEGNEYGELDGSDEIELENGSDEEPNAVNRLPAHLKEISSLASWTVSTHKPGCGVAALCHQSTSQFWQSDGPQPHFLNIHFVKMVSISYMRVYLDFEQDESYTPTKLHFLAGTGHHDLQNVCIMSFKEPKGWLDVDLSNAGGPNPFEDGDLDEEELEMDPAVKRLHQPGYGPTLRCRIVQLRILENHQNGKDTHLRGLQIFAIDESAIRTRRKRKNGLSNNRNKQKPSKTISDGVSRPRDLQRTPNTPNHSKQDMERLQPEGASQVPSGSSDPTRTPAANNDEDVVITSNSDKKTGRGKRRSIPLAGLREPEWMGEPTLR